MKRDCDSIEKLTKKQREVLDLLVQYKTSKQIAVELGISHHTVDQRIQFAKRVFGVDARSELAQRYREALLICERLTYEESHMSKSNSSSQQVHTDEVSALLAPIVTSEFGSGVTTKSRSLVPELFEGRNGVLFRLGAIAFTAFLMVIVVLGGMAIFEVVSDVLN